MVKRSTSNDIRFGLIELQPDGTIVKANHLGKKLLMSDENSSDSIFHRLKNNEIKAKLHEYYMGKANNFIITIDTQPHFILFHRTANNEQHDLIYFYIFNMHDLQSSYDRV